MAEDFSNLLQKYMDEWGHGTTILASEASIRLRAAGAPELPRATIDNWLRGTVKRVRDWRSIVAIADVFFLDEEAANKLLKVADHREIRELWNIATEKERRLLRWIFYTPDQRLRPPEPFVGRQEELNQLQKDLKPGQVVALCGPGGIGKTALAAKAIWPLFPDRFPDGVVNFNFYKQPESSLAFEHIAWSFGEEVGSAPRAAAQRALSRRRRALLILDGTENAVDLPAVLDICGHCAVLIISRRRQDGIAAAEMRRDVPRLPRSEAVRLLQVTGGNWAKDTRACERICDLVGDLPLAVWLVGCYLNAGEAEEAADYLTRLEQEPLLTLDQRVSQLLQQSLSQVSEKACEVLAIAGALALAPFSREVIAAAWTGGSNVGPALGELVNYGLLRVGHGEACSADIPLMFRKSGTRVPL